MNSLSFCLTFFFSCSSFLEGSFPRYYSSFTVFFFSFSFLSISFQLLPAYKICAKKCIDSLIWTSFVHGKRFFSCFQNSLFVFNFWQFGYNVSQCRFLCCFCSPLGLWIWCLLPFPNLESLGPLIFLKKPLALLGPP